MKVDWLPRRGTAARQASFVVLGDGMTFAGLFVTTMIMARIVGKADMATYRQVLYVGPLAISIVEFGISSTVYRFVPFYKDEERKAFLWDALVAMTVLGAVASLALALLSRPLAVAFHNDALAPALRIAAAYPLAMMPFMLVRPVLICEGHSLKATSLETIFALGTAVAFLAPLAVGASLNAALVFWMGANASRLPVTAWLMWRVLRGVRFRWERSVVKDVWGYAWPLQASRIPGIAIQYFDKLVTSVMLSTSAFAAYSLGARELPFVNSIAFSMSSVLVPQMVTAIQSGGVDRVCQLWRKASVSTAIVTYPFAAFSVWYAKPIICVLFTSAYEDSAIPFRFFAGITFLRVINYGSLAKALGESRIIMTATVITMMVSLPISVAMAYLWGIWGVSVSLLVSTMVMSAYYLLRYKRLLRCPISAFFPMGSLALVGAVSIAAVLMADACLGRALGIEEEVLAARLAFRLLAVFAVAASAYVGGWALIRKAYPGFFVNVALPGLRA
ncbi:MAG TPA: oligosaccharide flippase family protein [Thermoanaerobaculia bacterium]|nr:oligosaccharide flippase family protein [Thermoanaerobaculia bacterium]